MTDQVSLTPRTTEELVDSAWDRLGHEDSTGSEIRYISRAQLSEFMCEAALLAIGAAPLAGWTEGKGPAGALLQSLKVMGEGATKAKRPGWSVICQRAITFVERITNDVTRFLEYPGQLVSHPTMEADLHVASARFQEDGRISCEVEAPGAPDLGRRTFWFHELWPAGPVDDAVRLMVGAISRTIIEDMIAQIIRDGHMLTAEDVEPVAYLRDVDGTGSLHACAKDDPGAFPVFGRVPEPAGESETVHLELRDEEGESSGLRNE
jgi:hypothetical protein